MSERRALITGAGGFVGARLAERLVADGARAMLTVRPGSNAWRLAELRRHAELRELDLRDAAAVRETVAAADPDWVFHLAAHGAYSWQDDPDAIFATNLTGTRLLAQAAQQHGVAAFVQAGSSSEYGFKDHAPSEDEAPEPNSWYAVAKTAATLLGQHLRNEHDQPITTLRLSSVYGPWEEPRRLVPTLIAHALRGGLPPLVSPETGRDFVYVDDVCEAFVLTARAERPAHAIYNVGSGRQTSLRELVQMARSVFDVTVEPEWGGFEARAWDARVWVSDPRRIGADLGWAATTGLAAGLQATAGWLHDHPELAASYGLPG